MVTRGNLYQPGDFIVRRYEVKTQPILGNPIIDYQCFDHAEQRQVRLKTLALDFRRDDPAWREFFMAGFTWMGFKDHPNVVSCYALFEQYLEIEFVAKAQGRKDASLRSWLAQGQPLPPMECLLFVLQVARGMQHVQTLRPGLVHGSLKPENILVGEDKLPDYKTNRVRVTDFGMAGVLEEIVKSGQVDENMWLPNETEAFRCTQVVNGIVGTPLYMAPEQWRGEKTGIWTDIYALGCVLFEMISGKTVVTGKSLDDLKQAHCSGQTDALPGNVAEPISRLLQKCLAVIPENRWQTWGELADTLAETYQVASGIEAPSSIRDDEQDEEEEEEGDTADYSEQNEGFGPDEAGEIVTLHPDDDTQGITSQEQDARDYFQEIGARRHEGEAAFKLGNTYFRMGDFQRAIACYKQAAVISGATFQSDRQGVCLFNIGMSYLELEDTQQAIDFFEQGLAIFRESSATSVPNLAGIARTSLSLAAIYTENKQPDKALPLAQEAAKIYSQMGDPEGAQQARWLVRKIQELMPGPEAGAHKFLDQGLDAFVSANSLEEMQEAVKKCFLLKDATMIAKLERMISEQVPVDRKPEFEQRLIWLKQIAGK